jgi:hypothetical protein
MDGLTLEFVMRQDPHARALFEGVFASDTLPHALHRRPSLLIVNTDPISKGGSHWLAIYISCEGKGEFFDSYGLPPYVPQIRSFLDKRCKSWRYNTVDLQAVNTTVCGQYCVMYLLFKAHGYSLFDFVKNFSNECLKNDETVHRMFERYSKNVKLCDDVRVKKNQVCCKRKQ